MTMLFEVPMDRSVEVVEVQEVFELRMTEKESDSDAEVTAAASAIINSSHVGAESRLRWLLLQPEPPNGASMECPEK
jgi:hypothetical protein